MNDDLVKVDARDADERIRRLALFLSDLRPFWPVVYRLVAGAGGWWSRQFETEGAFAGRRWQQLSEPYARIKATVFPGKPILQARGGIRRAASRPKRIATPRSLTLLIDDSDEQHGISGSRGPILQYHQEGRGVPARPLVFGDPLPRAAEAELEQAADDYVRDLLRRI